ncbi:MAG: hypothetical protein RTV31_10255 [Candidatus Thorarchaeota archaeon]
MTYTKKELKNYLKDLLKEKRELTDFSFEYQSGHLDFHARLRIILSSGKIIHWKIPKKTPVDLEKEKVEAKISEMDISKEQLLDFLKNITKRKIWDIENCDYRALSDTPLLYFKIKNKDQLVFETEVWEACRNDSVRVKEIIRALGTLLPRDLTPP